MSAIVNAIPFMVLAIFCAMQVYMWGHVVRYGWSGPEDYMIVFHLVFGVTTITYGWSRW